MTMNEKPKVNRSLEPRVGAPREADERRRVAEIARDIEELGRAMENRDHPTRFSTAERTKGWSAQARQSAGQELERQLAAHGDDQKLLAQERARREELEQHLAVRADDQKLLAQERARREELERQLAVRADDQKLLAQERARIQELEQRLAVRGDDQKLLAQERVRRQELEQQLAVRGDDQKLLVQERARIQELEQRLAVRGDDQKLLAQERVRRQELERQLAVRGDDQKLLVQERVRIQELEQQLAAHAADDQKLLAQERVRRQELEQQLAGRWDATLDRGRSLTVTLSNRPTSVPTTPDAHGSLEAARLMEEGRRLLDQGNVGTARNVLQRAADSGSATALFLLAETYDRAMLSAWGIFGRHGNVRKARELYTKAVAGGVHEAKYRLNALERPRA